MVKHSNRSAPHLAGCALSEPFFCSIVPEEVNCRLRLCRIWSLNQLV
jgi:hypothetical protein